MTGQPRTRQFVGMNLDVEFRDELRQAKLDMTSPVGRAVSLSDVGRAALKVAKAHPEEFLAALRGDE